MACRPRREFRQRFLRRRKWQKRSGRLWAKTSEMTAPPHGRNTYWTQVPSGAGKEPFWRDQLNRLFASPAPHVEPLLALVFGQEAGLVRQKLVEVAAADEAILEAMHDGPDFTCSGWQTKFDVGDSRVQLNFLVGIALMSVSTVETDELLRLHRELTR
jgi:hypothetical protein